ncbi:MAG TPA: type II toxin-antitoxin system VapC family toxin [Thermoanaerobaculia bacterium]|nr:type II toxin-antitoxin system VapC family toxin [Thermoanaerobaculia bacterium]
MRIVLDASAAVEAVMDDESKVHALLEYASAILAPEHFIVEVTSGLWKYVTLRGLPVDDAAERLEVALEISPRSLGTSPFCL